MIKLSLQFLYDLPYTETVFTASQVKDLAEEVHRVLKENRSSRELSDEEVLRGNKFLLSLVMFSQLDENLDIDISPEDVEYMLAEVAFLSMDYVRN